MDVQINLDERSKEDLIDIIKTAVLRYEEPYRLASFLERYQEAVPEFKNIAISLKAGIEEYNEHFSGGDKELSLKEIDHEAKVNTAVLQTLIDINRK